MKTKDEYVRLMQAKLDEWSAEFDVLSAKAGQMAAGLKVDYGRQIESLEAKRAVARQKLGELQQPSESAWEDLKSGVEQAWGAMGEALAAARSRFK